MYPHFHQKWEVIWEEQNVNTKKPFYHVFFIIRRLVFSALLVFPPLLNISPVIQLMIIIKLNLFSTAYNIANKHFIEKRRNIIEVFNEYFNLLISTYFLNSANNASGEQVYLSGIVTNYLIITMYLVNLAFVLHGALKEMILKCKRKKALKAREKA